MYDDWEDPVGPYDGSIVMDAPPPPDLAITGWSPLPDWADPLFGTAPVGADVAGNPVVLMDDDYLDYRHEKASGDVILSGGIGDEDEDLPDGGTVDDVIVTGDLRDRDSPSIAGPGFTPGGSGVVMGGDPTTNNGFSGGETVTNTICALDDLVEDLDGKFFGDNDGDGIDELINRLTVASVALGFGGLAGFAARAAVGGVNSGAFLSAISSVFGDDIALRISYMAFGEIAVASSAASAFTASFKEILEVLSDGNPPSECQG